MRLIDVSTKKFPNTFAKVDDEDYAYLSGFTWHAMKNPDERSIYASTDWWIGGKHKSLRMHRVLLKNAGVIDHRDGDGLNNQRCNLRACTASNNQQNRKTGWGKSRFKGVDQRNDTQLWRAKIRFDGKQHSLGQFKCEGCAAIAYDAAALAIFGEFAAPNFWHV